MAEQVFSNARIVLADRVVMGGLVVRDGRIADISDTPSRLAGAADLDGDYLIPGLIDLHTDNLERHMLPSAVAPWPSTVAVMAHDMQMAGAGVTTVLNALSLGDRAGLGPGVELERLGEMIDGLTCAAGEGTLRADHLLNLRCDVGFPDMLGQLERLARHPLLRLISLMDGARGRHSHPNASRNSACAGDLARSRRLALASHADATRAHVDEAAAAGVSLVGFPATVEAAAMARRAGLHVSMGGPNVVRGGSQRGSAAAHELAANGCLDIVVSDDVPYSQIHAAVLLCETVDGYDLAAAIRAVTKAPAEAVGLDDRGEIAVGRRGDLVRVRCTAATPIVREVWREGRRVV